MSNFDNEAFMSAHADANLYVPRTGRMDNLVLALTRHGFGAANVADGWRRITLPEETLRVQLELGEPINQDLLSCVVLNDKIPAGEYFPLVSEEYDRLDITLEHDNIDEIAQKVYDFYKSALETQ